MTELLLIVAALAILIVPGLAVAEYALVDRPLLQRLLLGAILGPAIAVLLAYVTGGHRLSWFWPIFGVLAVVASALLIKRRVWQHVPTRPSLPSIVFVVVLVVVAVSRIGICFDHVVPRGWDPTLHLMMARKIHEVNGLIRDLEPFQPMTINYPLGSHLLTVVLARFTAVPLHTVYKFLMALFGLFSVAGVYVLARAATKRPDMAALSAAIYGVLPLYGSIDYYNWGGLPNQMAMLFLIAACAIVCTGRQRRGDLLCFGLFYSAMLITHHHVMLASGAVLAALFVWSWWQQREAMIHSAVFKGLVVSAVFTAAYIIPYALRVSQLQKTGVMKFQEPLMTPSLLAASLGYGFILALVVAIPGYWRVRKTIDGRAALETAALALVALFVLFAYGYRQWSIWKHGEPYVAFTPSRFLTDAVYFLAILTAIGLRSLAGARKHAFPVLVAIVLLLGLGNWRQWQAMRGNPLPVEKYEAYRWIDTNLPSKTIIVTMEPWAVYSAWRTTLNPPAHMASVRTRDNPVTRIVTERMNGTLTDENRDWLLVAVNDYRTINTPHTLLWQHESGMAVVELHALKPTTPTKSLQKKDGTE